MEFRNEICDWSYDDRAHGQAPTAQPPRRTSTRVLPSYVAVVDSPTQGALMRSPETTAVIASTFSIGTETRR